MMLEPKIYVRCDVLEVGKQDIQVFDNKDEYDDFEGAFSLAYTTEKTDKYFKLNLNFELRFKNQYDVSKILVKLPYSFTYTLKKYKEYGLESIKISALNEIASEISEYYGFYLMLLFQCKVKSNVKEMS